MSDEDVRRLVAEVEEKWYASNREIARLRDALGELGAIVGEAGDYGAEYEVAEEVGAFFVRMARILRPLLDPALATPIPPVPAGAPELPDALMASRLLCVADFLDEDGGFPKASKYIRTHAEHLAAARAGDQESGEAGK